MKIQHVLLITMFNSILLACGKDNSPVLNPVTDASYIDICESPANVPCSQGVATYGCDSVSVYEEPGGTGGYDSDFVLSATFHNGWSLAIKIRRGTNPMVGVYSLSGTTGPGSGGLDPGFGYFLYNLNGCTGYTTIFNGGGSFQITNWNDQTRLVSGKYDVWGPDEHINNCQTPTGNTKFFSGKFENVPVGYNTMGGANHIYPCDLVQ